MEENVKEKAIIVAVNDTTDEIFNYELQELVALCEACQMEVIDEVVQNLTTFNNATYIGSGKMAELKKLKDTYAINTIVFLDELTPAQNRNLSEYLQVEVIDRTMLILEIFAKRARTKEAILQVEIAKLKYMLPRLAGSYQDMSRLGGTSSGAGGVLRGSGETKLETDRRHIEKRITKAQKELALIVKGRKNARKKRLDNKAKIVAFVGYTNAGKSSTINTLLSMYASQNNKEVYVEDMLFATLDTSTRAIKLDTNEEILITDTVGFVSNLPHHLIESFKSTLEEIKEASLIVHVVDASSPSAALQIDTTNQVLSSLGVSNIPMLYLLNKNDLVKNTIFLPKVNGDKIIISNKTKEGFLKLVSYMKEKLFPDLVRVKLLIPFDKGEIFNILKTKANIHTFNYQNDGILVDVSMSNYLYNLYKSLII